MRIIERTRIDRLLANLDLVALIEQAFRDYSAGRAIVPPVGELLLDAGEVHIKYGAIAGGERNVVKIASGFYGNAALGLPSSNGLVLVFRADTGEPEAILLDEGHLTDVRTAVAGAVGARALARPDTDRIGVLGTGTQARLPVQHLAPVVGTRAVVSLGRDRVRAERYRSDLNAAGFSVAVATTPAEVAAACDLIVTTTPSTEPLLTAADIRPGMHITAIGSNTAAKQELAADVLARADVVVADSLEQCRTRGEIARAVAAGATGRTRPSSWGTAGGGGRPAHAPRAGHGLRLDGRGSAGHRHRHGHRGSPRRGVSERWGLVCPVPGRLLVGSGLPDRDEQQRDHQHERDQGQ